MNALHRIVLVCTAFVAALVVVPKAAHAHALGVSNGDYVVQGNELVATLIFSRAELDAVAPALDRAALESAIVSRVQVRPIASKMADVALCAGQLTSIDKTENDGVALHARFRCAQAPERVAVHLGFFDDLTHGHRHVVRGPSLDDVCHRGHADFEIARAQPAQAAPTLSATQFVRMGVEHILSGYDHLLFLFALILVARRARAMVGVVSSFTIAHSITLGLAALDVWTPSARIVEPAIALSIAYVGVENLLVMMRGGRHASLVDHRWLVTFAFGLVHGFGFAGALREIDLPRGDVPVALVGFNVGVELGQLAVIAALLPLLALLRSQQRFAPRVVRALSFGVVGLGLIWFVERVAFV